VADAAVTTELRVTGPDPAVRRPVALPAAAFHTYAQLVTAARDRTVGSCIEVHPAHETGWAQYDRIMLEGFRGVRLLVARRWLPAHRASRVRLTARTSGNDSWQARTDWAEVTVADPYDWREISLDILALAPSTGRGGSIDLRVEIEGAARVAELTFI
jgi:hypothetical protein